MNAISSLLRRQLRTPLFALIVTVLVAAVVAFNASAFSAIHALRWKALPYVDGERLVELQARLVNCLGQCAVSLPVGSGQTAR